jgi:uracil-DNA glycosylase
MSQEERKSTGNIQRAMRQRLESLRGAGVSHISKPKAGSREPGVKAKEHGATRQIAVMPTPLTPSPSPKGRGEQLAAPAPSPASPPVALSREEALATVAKRVAACTRCSVLVKNRTQTVFGVGDPNAKLVFIGEAPGADEDRQGEPFVGRAGQLLTDIITKGMKLRREDVYIMNILRCRPPENRTPLPDEAANCREYLEAQLAIIQPQYLCCLGACAAQNLLGVDTLIGKLRGRLIDFRGMKVLCTYHPAYLLRNPPAKKQVWEDIQVLMKEMRLM